MRSFPRRLYRDFVTIDLLPWAVTCQLSDIKWLPEGVANLSPTNTFSPIFHPRPLSAVSLAWSETVDLLGVSASCSSRRSVRLSSIFNGTGFIFAFRTKLPSPPTAILLCSSSAVSSRMLHVLESITCFATEAPPPLALGHYPLTDTALLLLRWAN